MATRAEATGVGGRRRARLGRGRRRAPRRASRSRSASRRRRRGRRRRRLGGRRRRRRLLVSVARRRRRRSASRRASWRAAEEAGRPVGCRATESPKIASSDAVTTTAAAEGEQAGDEPELHHWRVRKRPRSGRAGRTGRPPGPVRPERLLLGVAAARSRGRSGSRTAARRRRAQTRRGQVTFSTGRLSASEPRATMIGVIAAATTLPGSQSSGTTTAATAAAARDQEGLDRERRSDCSRLTPSYASDSTCEPGTMSSPPSGQRTHALWPPS